MRYRTSPVVVLQPAREAADDGRAGQMQQDTDRMMRHGVDAIALRASVDVEGATADAARMPRGEEPTVNVQRRAAHADEEAALTAFERVAID